MHETIRVDPAPRGQMWSRRVRLEDADDRFDLAFWQAQSAEARLAAGWELVETAWELKGRPSDELRLQRTVGRFVPFPERAGRRQDELDLEKLRHRMQEEQ